MLQNSRFEIYTAFNCMIYFQNSSNVENHHLNCACQCCAKHDGKFFINVNSKHQKMCRIKPVWNMLFLMSKQYKNNVLSYL